MDVTPTTPQPRPTAAKQGAVKTNDPGKKAKPGRGRKATLSEPQIIEAHLTQMSGETASDLNQRIATTAYYMAAARNFEPGHELEDWLEAERQVRAGH